MSDSGVTYSDVEITLGRDLSETEQTQATRWITDAEMLIEARLGDLTKLNSDRLAYVVRESVANRFRSAVSGGAESVTVSVDDGSVTKRFDGERGTADGDWLLDGWVSLLSARKKGGPFSIMPWFDSDSSSSAS